MRRLSILAAVLCAAAVLTACGSVEEGKNGVKKITAKEAKELMDAGGVTVVDVRRQDEYDEGHVPGAVLVTNETIGEEAPGLLPDREAVILVYCRSGRRSAEAAEKLVGLGYENIYDFGGILDWPYGTEKGE